MPNMSRKQRFITVLFGIVIYLSFAIVIPSAENRETWMIFQTVSLTMYFAGEIRLVMIGRESVGKPGKVILFAGTLASLLPGVISIGLVLKQVAETGDSTPIPIYYFLIGTVAGLGYCYVLYDEKVHEEKEL